MTLLARLYCGALAVLLCASLNGCTPSGQSQLEEEKEPHFLDGKSYINGMDYKGAIEKFEEALEANPNSASAHFQLGWLYEEKEPDPAAAIYHYEQFLKLRPQYENAEVIRQQITICKQDLAKTVLPLPIAPEMQRQFEQLAEENKRLREELNQWKAFYASRPPATNALATGPPRPSPAPANPPLAYTNPMVSNPENGSRPSSARTHLVQDGESLYGVAKKYGVKLDALIAANPGVEPRRLRPGQTLKVPAP